ncbi:hypothetical protein COLO4_04178 [Corchorus olitorius]|uniref:Uncharacterized protein n=1 Tax=Corchorus olitorius TaxID=93759 RepID=A0A1R3KV37_9ROSI|nr:hypothetical protein COLO4_04178 [Corchorus olitorius]
MDPYPLSLSDLQGIRYLLPLVLTCLETWDNIRLTLRLGGAAENSDLLWDTTVGSVCVLALIHVIASFIGVVRG